MAALDPVALPGGYPNLLGPDDDERARASYGANLDRLLAAKLRYDPADAFSSAVPALLEPPGASPAGESGRPGGVTAAAQRDRAWP